MIQTNHAHVPLAAQTHPGMRGKNNEDSYAVSAYQLSEENSIPSLVAVLADGIGGHRAGEVASKLAVDIVSTTLSASDATQPLETIRTAMQDASNAIYATAQEDDGRKGMGATCSVVWLIDNRIYSANIGDSRIYLMRGNHIQQISNDHTWIQEALEMGLLKPEQVAGHPNAHVIRRYLGSPEPSEPDFRLHLKKDESDEQARANQGLVVKSDDILLLCSDGLTDLVNNEEILAEYRSKSLEEATARLIDLANERGGHDNITIVAFNGPNAPEQPPTPAAKKKTPWLFIGCGTLIVIGIFIAVVLGGTLLLRGGLTKFDPFHLKTTATQTATQPGITLQAPGVEPALQTPTIGKITSTKNPVPLMTETASPTVEYIQPGAATLTPWPTHTQNP